MENAVTGPLRHGAFGKAPRSRFATQDAGADSRSATVHRCNRAAKMRPQRCENADSTLNRQVLISDEVSPATPMEDASDNNNPRMTQVRARHADARSRVRAIASRGDDRRSV